MSQIDDTGLLPGADMVELGLADLSQNKLTEFSLLVLIAAPRLQRLGIHIPERSWMPPYEHRLYERLEQRYGDAAYSAYNSLIRRIVSYAHALEREQSQIMRATRKSY